MIADELDAKLLAAESEWAKRLADRIQARSAEGQPGLMVFNPCGSDGPSSHGLRTTRGTLNPAQNRELKWFGISGGGVGFVSR